MSDPLEKVKCFFDHVRPLPECGWCNAAGEHARAEEYARDIKAKDATIARLERELEREKKAHAATAGSHVRLREENERLERELQQAKDAVVIERGEWELQCERAEKAEAFKSYVHQRLDEAGVPTHPDGPHSKAGCRVGDRLDYLIAGVDHGVAVWSKVTKQRDQLRRELSAAHDALGVAMEREKELRAALERATKFIEDDTCRHDAEKVEVLMQIDAALSTKEQP